MSVLERVAVPEPLMAKVAPEPASPTDTCAVPVGFKVKLVPVSTMEELDPDKVPLPIVTDPAFTMVLLRVKVLPPVTVILATLLSMVAPLKVKLLPPVTIKFMG